MCFTESCCDILSSILVTHQEMCYIFIMKSFFLKFLPSATFGSIVFIVLLLALVINYDNTAYGMSIIEKHGLYIILINILLSIIPYLIICYLNKRLRLQLQHPLHYALCGLFCGLITIILLTTIFSLIDFRYKRIFGEELFWMIFIPMYLIAGLISGISYYSRNRKKTNSSNGTIRKIPNKIFQPKKEGYSKTVPLTDIFRKIIPNGIFQQKGEGQQEVTIPNMNDGVKKFSIKHNPLIWVTIGILLVFIILLMFFNYELFTVPSYKIDSVILIISNNLILLLLLWCLHCFLKDSFSKTHLYKTGSKTNGIISDISCYECDDGEGYKHWRCDFIVTFKDKELVSHSATIKGIPQHFTEGLSIGDEIMLLYNEKALDKVTVPKFDRVEL